MALLHNILDLYLEAAPWLFFGLVTAGVIKAWLPATSVQRLVGGKGPGAVVSAALVGAPLPLCSCGVLPAAVGLRRAGASRPATVSFMISTPETGVDSVAVTYALLGPFLAVARPIAAVSSAIFTGLLTAFAPDTEADTAPTKAAAGDTECCGSSAPESAAVAPGGLRRTLDGIRYALVDILEDIAPWLGLGLVVAGLLTTYVPTQALAQWGSGPFAMGVMIVIGIPMYICATASTPLAAGFLVAGVSPGAVMVFLLAGPATNLATIAVVRKEMGTQTMVLYLTGVCLSSLAAGLVVDYLVKVLAIDVTAQLDAVGAAFLPAGVAELAAIALALVVARRFVPTLFARALRQDGG